MNRITLFVKVIIVFYATQSQAEVQVNCDENVDLSCPCQDSKNFLELTWHKINDRGRPAIISVSAGVTETYPFPRPARFGEGQRLHLLKVTPEDSGKYICVITAGLRHENKECMVDLLVHACATPKPNAFNTTVNSSRHVEDLPITWSILGYLAVGLVKVLLSSITILVIRACRIRSSR